MTVTSEAINTLALDVEATAAGVKIRGGDYSVECIAGTWNSATAQLQKLTAADGTTYVDVTDVSFTADAALRAILPTGTYRCEITGSPTNVTMVLVHGR